ncbi:hypothetical protein OS242_17510 [Tumebacillus sp. DT12]|uniref:Uncharacterized protein n=1 Tax=Tumebacillus lacus TaxID=2995335 RepID=A0ABT3XAH0_9BACL|nr:hypothetical protein [Tumebacillus lacus]MCX7571744.1 hypothetical protein [Tumebacillus lacus]
MSKKNDCCCLCQAETEFEADTPSYERSHYIDTAGQLCPECYSVIAVNKEWHNLL